MGSANTTFSKGGEKQGIEIRSPEPVPLRQAPLLKQLNNLP